jgi:IBR domain, a half RING-finger domain
MVSGNIGSTSNALRYENMIQNTKEQDCAICAETLRAPQFPETRVTEGCTHAPNTCFECIRRNIDSQLETRMWNQLSCPECPARLGYADVEKYASKPTFQRYDSLALRDGISSDPNFRWCTAPSCNSGQVHSEGAESPLMICNSCRLLSCFTHQTPWHEGMTCVEFDSPEAAQGTSETSKPAGSGGLLSSLAEMCGWNREIVLGGVKRRETDQEKKDRKIAMRLFQEQEEVERARLQRIEQESRERAEAEEAEQREEQRRALEAQEERERRERELQLQREERQRQAQETQQARARQRKEESASTTLLQMNTKACPGNCGWRIEKNDGCDHMTCGISQTMSASYSIADFKVPQAPVAAINFAGYVSRLGRPYNETGIHPMRRLASIILGIYEGAI